MKQESELDRLEHFVSGLMARYSDLQKVNEGLNQDVQERDEIIEKLRKNMALIESERAEIGNRVNGIILEIEEWERNTAGSVQSSRTADNPEGRVQGKLFSLGAEDQEEIEND